VELVYEVVNPRDAIKILLYRPLQQLRTWRTLKKLLIKKTDYSNMPVAFIILNNFLLTEDTA
jgi:hypothetical protein